MEHVGCKSLNRYGKPCQAWPGENGLCFFHAHPEKASELGRQGGRKNRQIVEDPRPLPPLDSTDGVKRAFIQLIEDLNAKRITFRTAGVQGKLLHDFHELLLAQEMKAEVAEVRKRVAEVESSNGRVQLATASVTESTVMTS